MGICVYANYQCAQFASQIAERPRRGPPRWGGGLPRWTSPGCVKVGVWWKAEWPLGSEKARKRRSFTQFDTAYELWAWGRRSICEAPTINEVHGGLNVILADVNGSLELHRLTPVACDLYCSLYVPGVG